MVHGRSLYKAINLILFSKANVDYDALANLIRSCQDKPLHDMTKKLRNVSADRISAIAKNEHPALCIADLVAHALYKCVDKNDKNFGIIEARYLRELSPRFFANPITSKALDGGLYCVHSMRDLELEDEATQLFQSMTPD